MKLRFIILDIITALDALYGEYRLSALHCVIASGLVPFAQALVHRFVKSAPRRSLDGLSVFDLCLCLGGKESMKIYAHLKKSYGAPYTSSSVAQTGADVARRARGLRVVEERSWKKLRSVCVLL